MASVEEIRAREAAHRAKAYDNAPGGSNYGRSMRSGGGGYGSGDVKAFDNVAAPMSDPIAQIISRIAQLKSYHAGQGSNSVTTYMNQSGEENALQMYLNELQEEKRLAAEQSRRNVPKLRSSAPPRQYGQSGVGSLGGQFDEEDDNSRARRRAVEAAMKYMSIKNPHLISSLGLGKLGK